MPPNYDDANERGAWAVGTAYSTYDVIEFEGQSYEAVQGSTGVDPSGDSANTYWTPVAKEAPLPSQTAGTVALNEATYTARNGDVIIATVNTTITLPAPSVNGKIVVISNGASITATVAAPTSYTVNGAASVTVTTQYTRKEFYSDGYTWLACT